MTCHVPDPVIDHESHHATALGGPSNRSMLLESPERPEVDNSRPRLTSPEVFAYLNGRADGGGVPGHEDLIRDIGVRLLAVLAFLL